MDTEQVVELLPRLVAHIEDLSGFRTLLPEVPGGDGTCWYGCECGPAIVTFMINGRAELRLTIGIAQGARLDDDLRHHINELNAKALMVGRLYYVQGNPGTAAVIMQEIVACEHFDGGPSINAILMTIAEASGIAARFVPEICHRHDAQPWSADEALGVTMLG